MLNHTSIPGVCAALVCGAAAAAYPERPITLIVTTAAGGPNDTVGRLVAAELGNALKTPVVVDNVAGAGGNIAARKAADSAADGYTLLLMSTSLVVNPSLYPSVPYDPVKSFRPIGAIGTSPHVLAASPQSGIRTFADALSTAAKKPGALTYASGGNGTTSHLGMELLKNLGKVDILHVPYKGAGPAMLDAAAGRVDLVMFPVPSLEPFVRSGKLTGLVVTDAQRVARLPDVPSTAQTPMPQLQVLGWWGVVAPANTPAAVASTLESALQRALSSPHLQESLRAQGLQVQSGSATTFGKFIVDETAKWKTVVTASGAKVDP